MALDYGYGARIATPFQRPNFTESDEDLLSLLAVKITQCELARDRGYQISSQELPFLSEDGITIPDFRAYLVLQQESIWRNNPSAPMARPRWLLTNSYYRIAPNGRRMAMLVYYGAAQSSSKSGLVDTSTIQQFTSTVINQKRTMDQNINQKTSLEHVILVVPTALNSDAGKHLAGFNTVPVTVYQDEELVYNPVYHVDTSGHQLLSAEEAAEVKVRLHMTNKDFLIAERTEPVVKYHGWPPLSILRVIRTDDEINLVVDHSTNYRIVI